MKKYDLVVFDVDGTLLDTTEGVLSSVKYAIKNYDLPVPTYNELLEFIGPPVQNSFARCFNLSGDALQGITNVFREQYKNVDLLKAKPYDGIYDMLDILAEKYAIAVATYKREDYALTLLKHYGFDKYAKIMHGGDNFNKLSKADIILKCVTESGIADRKKAVMVGDTISDAVGAEKAGIDFIAVTYGFGFKTDDSLTGLKCVGIAEQPMDLSDLIFKMEIEK